MRPFEPQPQLNKAPSPNTNPGSIGSFVKLSPTLNPKLGVPFPGILASAFTTTPVCALLANTVELATSRTALTPPPLSAISSPRNLSEIRLKFLRILVSLLRNPKLSDRNSVLQDSHRVVERERAREREGESARSPRGVPSSARSLALRLPAWNNGRRRIGRGTPSTVHPL